MIPGVWVFVLLALAAYRVWQLVANDVILDGPRSRLSVPVTDFLSCPFCAGFWIAVAWWGAWIEWPHATIVVAVPFALAAAVAMVAVGMGALVSE